MAVRKASRGTREPISIRPSLSGSVSSNTASLVKFRMEKLSSHLSWHGLRWPLLSYSTLIRRENITKALSSGTTLASSHKKHDTHFTDATDYTDKVGAKNQLDD